MSILGDLGSAVGGAVGGVVGGVLNLVVPQVSEAISQFGSQQNVIEDMVRAPIRGMLDEVGGGEVWRGPGAEKFLSELNETFLPGSQTVKDDIGGITDSVRNAAEIIQQADKKAAGLANELAEQFRDITKTL